MYGRPPVDRLARRLSANGSAKILFLSNHGAARALIAESIVNRYRAGGFTAVAAGVSPEGTPHPMAEELLRAYRLPAPRPRPISVDEAFDTEAQGVDYVVALWDRSCGEPFPATYNDALAASWDVPDPRRPYDAGAGIIGSRVGFVRAYMGLRQRIERLFSDVREERRLATGEDFDLAAIEDDAPLSLIRKQGPCSDLRSKRGPNAGSEGAPAPLARRRWSFGGMFDRAPASGRSLEEPLSLGRSELAREPRRAPRA